MPALEDAARDYGDFSIDDDRLIVVHLLLFGPDLGAPSVEDARAWAEHYGYDDKPNHIVLVGDERMQGQATFAMIPGFQLVDKSFKLRLDGAGNNARDDLWTSLLPSVSLLMGE